MTRRDALALRWVAEQYAVRFDTLAVVLGRLTPVEGREPEPLAATTARNHAARWERLGWVRVFSALSDRWVTPTALGLRLAGVPFPEWVPAGTRLEHVHTVGVVRLWVERTEPRLEWVCERYLWRELDRARNQAKAQGDPQPAWHVPDALLVEQGGVGPEGTVERSIPRWLIEVELHQKADARVEAALYNRWPGRLVGVQYYTRPELESTIAAQLARVLALLRGRGEPGLPEVKVARLPDVSGVTLEGGW